MDRDHQLRLRAFEHLDRLLAGREERCATSSELTTGFVVDGERITLIGQKGIWKPRSMQLPISITTAPPKQGKRPPYDDQLTAEGTILYRYRGTDAAHSDNVGLRACFEENRPLVYFHGVAEGVYEPMYPAFIVRDDPSQLAVEIQIDSVAVHTEPGQIASEGPTTRRAYVTATAVRRLHQDVFRRRVLHAYRERCTVCSLKQVRLLDAAHIIPDKEEKGVPEVHNGLALCKIHHGAFDADLFGIDPDLRIHVRRDVLDEEDGPMLLHGLQLINDTKLVAIPHRAQDRPRREFLDERFQRFLKAE